MDKIKSHTCYCDHSDTLHRWDEKSKQYKDCVYLWHDGPCTCSKFDARPIKPARFDLNGLVLG